MYCFWINTYTKLKQKKVWIDFSSYMCFSLEIIVFELIRTISLNKKKVWMDFSAYMWNSWTSKVSIFLFIMKYFQHRASLMKMRLMKDKNPDFRCIFNDYQIWALYLKRNDALNKTHELYLWTKLIFRVLKLFGMSKYHFCYFDNN